MAEPTLSIAYDDLTAEVGAFLGYGRTAWSSDADKTAEIDSVVQAGYRQYLFPPMIEEMKVPYEWNFLFVEEGLKTEDAPDSGISSDRVPAPDDFGGTLKDVTIWKNLTDRKRVQVVTYAQLAALQSRQIAMPEYVAVVPVSYPDITTKAEAYDFLFYPKPEPEPEGLYFFSFRYNLVPHKLASGADTEYPIGGAKHSELLLQSCLAVAEHRSDDSDSTHHQQRFMVLLRGHIELDKREARRDGPVYQPDAKSDDLNVTFADLVRETGALLGYDHDQASWEPHQKRNVDYLVQTGFRQFCAPPVLEGQAGPHDWNFLKPMDTLTLTAEEVAYTLPAGFGSLIGELTYSSTAPTA